MLQVPGIDVNAKSNDGNTALMQAAQEVHTDVVRELVKDPGIDVNVKDSDGGTALIVAATNGHTKVVRTLLKASVTAMQKIMLAG